MAITADWTNTETQARGRQTEVIVPLLGATDVDPVYYDQVAQQVVGAGVGDPRRGSPALWQQGQMDSGNLRLLLTGVPQVARIKTVVDDALETASAWLAEQEAARQVGLEQAKLNAARRDEQLGELRDSFRLT
jgi:hypothetical protein